MIRFIVASLFGILLCSAAHAETRCMPHIEVDAKQQTATFKPHTDAFANCPISEVTYQRVIAAWLRSKPDTTFKSISLGRAVDYPWISRYLVEVALQGGAWDLKTGRSINANDNETVAAMLTDPLIRARLQWPFNGSGYTVTSVSVEKVLVDVAKNTFPESAQPLAKAPFDAQVWLILEKN